MHKLLTFALTTGVLLATSFAQQTPSSNQTPSSTTGSKSQTSTASKSQTSTAKKPATGTAKSTAAPLTLKTSKDKFSYALGMKMGANLHKQNVPVDPAIFQRGMKDGLAGGKTLLTDEEAQSAIMDVQKEMREKQQAKMKEEGEENKKTGDAFLAQNKSKDGVKTTADGLQYKVITQGTGPTPTANDTVSVNYRGTLINGTEFDSSYKRGQPASFPVSGVIKGWTEALQLMPVGSKYQIFIPSDLAYGERGPGPEIGPNSTLIFEVELLSIEDKNKDKEKAPENPAKNPSETQKPPDNQEKK